MWVVGDVVLERFALVFWRREPMPSGWRQWGVAQAHPVMNVPTLVPIGSSVVSLEGGGREMAPGSPFVPAGASLASLPLQTCSEIVTNSPSPVP